MEFLGLLGLLAGGLGLTAVVSGSDSSNGDGGGDSTDYGIANEDLSSNDSDTDDDANGDTDDDIVDDTDSDTDGDDIGATFEYDGETNAVTIDVGEDEPRNLVALTVTNLTLENYYATGDPDLDVTPVLDSYQVRYYLVPDDVDWSNAAWENRSAYSDFHGEDTFGKFEQAYDMELLGTVDLDPDNQLKIGDAHPQPGHMDDPLPLLVSNAAPELYFLRTMMVDDEEYIEKFLPEDFRYTYDNQPIERVTTDTVGADNNDTLLVDGDDITLKGQGGNDVFFLNGKNVTVFGGAGNDSIFNSEYPMNSTSAAKWGIGRDLISIENLNATIHGGAGKDTISLAGDGLKIYGDNGNDAISMKGKGSEAYGGSGNDYMIGADEGVLYGGDGNDKIELFTGGTASGDAGDDTFFIQFADHPGLLGDVTLAMKPITATLGAGDDTVIVEVNGQRDDDYELVVTDFNIDEDTLELKSYDDQDGRAPYRPLIDDIKIVEAVDGSRTDINAAYSVSYDNAVQSGNIQIRLEGVTGMTMDDIKILPKPLA